MKKNLGILGLLLFVCVGTAIVNPNFVGELNLQNILRWSGLFAILAIGVSFVIITGGIDLSIGSVVGLVGCLLPWLLVHHGWSIGMALVAVIAVSMVIGLFHGLLITKLGLQPFIVTLCGLLIYRGLTRYFTDDQSQGFGTGYLGLRELATGKPCSLAFVAMVVGSGLLLWQVSKAVRSTVSRPALIAAGALTAAGGVVWLLDLQPASRILTPTPFLIMLALGALAGVFLRRTVWGRYLFALGRNEQAARYSGIRTDRMIVLAYVFCSLLAGIGGILFALDVNSMQPAEHGSIYELYAIAAAVLGGCSLRGGEGSIIGVIIGTAVMRALNNSIILLEISAQLEMFIVGLVILLGVIVDELVRRGAGRPRKTAD